MNDNIYLNPITQRVQNGTVPGDINLCASCRYAIKRNGSQTGFSEMRCGQLPGTPLVKEKLAMCSMYLEKGKLSLSEMGDVAWIIEARGKSIGFLSPEELQRRRDRANQPPSAPVGF